MSESLDTQAEDAERTERIDEEVVEAANSASLSSNPHVEALARAIGPRPPASEQEQEAADYLATALDQAGLPAAKLSTQVPRSGYLPELILTAAALVAIIVALLVPALGLLLLLGVLGAMMAEIYGYISIAEYLPAQSSVNVLSIVPPAETEVRRLIVTSTLDTGKVSLLSRRHLAHVCGWLHAVSIGAVALALLMTVVLLVDAGSSLRPVLVLPALVVLAVLALLAEHELAATASPGAISNASGVAAMIEIAGATLQAPPRWLEVWFLGAGASTARGGGMTAFLSRNTFDPDTTYFVHLQSTGAGKLSVPKSVGAGLRSAPATPLLTWIFDSVRQDSNKPDDRLQRLAVDSLAQVTHRAGYQSVVLAGVDESGRVPYLDNDEDLPYQVEEDRIDEAARLVRLAIDALDREVAARAMLARSKASIQNPAERPASSQEDLPTTAE